MARTKAVSQQRPATTAVSTPHKVNRPRSQRNYRWTPQLAEELKKLRGETFASFFSDVQDKQRVHQGWNNILGDLNTRLNANLTLSQVKTKWASMRFKEKRSVAVAGAVSGSAETESSQVGTDDASSLVIELPSELSQSQKSSRDASSISYIVNPSSSPQLETGETDATPVQDTTEGLNDQDEESQLPQALASFRAALEEPLERYRQYVMSRVILHLTTAQVQLINDVQQKNREVVDELRNFIQDLIGSIE